MDEALRALTTKLRKLFVEEPLVRFDNRYTIVYTWVYKNNIKFMSTSTNTKTILNFKIDKKLKQSAQRVAERIGVPLSTVINSFVKQFVADESVTFSTPSYRPTPYLIKIVEEAREEYLKGETFGPFYSAEEMIKSLDS